MSAEFQIPGLTTLSHPAQAGQVQTPSQDATPDGTHAPASARRISVGQDNGDTPVVATPSKDAESSNQGENKKQENTDPMVVDQPQVAAPENSDTAIPDAPQSPPSLTSGLEALLGGLDPVSEPSRNTTAQQNGSDQNGQAHGQQEEHHGEEEHPEWEEDSSPYESSSDSSSSDDSSDEDESEDEKGYKVLGPEETARILMEMEGGSDDEGDGKTKGGSSAQVRTKNELLEEVIPKPDVTITAEMDIIELGEVEHIVENTVVIKANTTGEYQVLDAGSVVCLESRTVIAAIADLIGSVRQPRYTARFNEDEIKALGLELGTKIFYPPSHATSVFTQALRGEKGTDASNWHDEEAGADEIEFSDDEKEAEYKRQQKAKKRGGRGGRDGAGGRGNRCETVNSIPASLKYDDDDDGPYRPLARPHGFGQGQQGPTSIEHADGHSGSGGAYHGGRGDFRGRGNRGRGGRGNRGGSRGGHSLPPRPPRGQDYQDQQSPQPQQYTFPPVLPPQFANQPYPTIPSQFNGQQPGPQYPFSWPQSPTPNLFSPPPPPPPPQFTGQTSAGGTYYNPAFFASVQNHMQGQYGQQNSQWPGPSGPG
ncbi:Gar1/Naf1 RNA binding region-domain-containing protein [Biscogniauxia marginata]|nr:Gar1/Naf1 RNA binding region-domain-containing protein [Biscogniauxia marginata]